MAEFESYEPHIVPKQANVIFPEQLKEMIVGEVQTAAQEIQTKLSEQNTLTDSRFEGLQSALQKEHMETVQQLELQNALLHRQQTIHMIESGLLFLVLVFAIIRLILICKQKKKLCELQVELCKLQGKVDQLDNINGLLTKCQNQQQVNGTKIEEIRSRLFDDNDSSTATIAKPLPQVETAPAATPPYRPVSLQDKLQYTLIQVSRNSSDHFGEQVKEKLSKDPTLQIAYYRRYDPNGRGYRGYVEETADDKATFFGVKESDTTLLLLPNKANLTEFGTCAREFFNGFTTDVKAASSIECAVLKREGELWKLIRFGSLKQ